MTTLFEKESLFVNEEDYKRKNTSRFTSKGAILLVLMAVIGVVGIQLWERNEGKVDVSDDITNMIWEADNGLRIYNRL